MDQKLLWIIILRLGYHTNLEYPVQCRLPGLERWQMEKSLAAQLGGYFR